MRFENLQSFSKEPKIKLKEVLEVRSALCHKCGAKVQVNRVTSGLLPHKGRSLQHNVCPTSGQPPAFLLVFCSCHGVVKAIRYSENKFILKGHYKPLSMRDECSISCAKGVYNSIEGVLELENE